MTHVIIGMDPHKRSVTIEVMGPDETVFDGGRYATDQSGYAAMLRAAPAVARSRGAAGSDGTSRRDCWLTASR